MSVQGKNQSHIRKENLGNILRLLCLHDGLSRTELSELMNLSKMGISKIVNELFEHGYLIEHKEPRELGTSRGGPTPLILSIAEDRLLAIGVSITLEAVECALADLSKGIIYSIRRAIYGPKDLDDIAPLIDEMLEKTRMLKKTSGKDPIILGIGLSLAGLVTSTQRYVDDRPKHLGTIRPNLKEYLSEKYQLPVFTMNNMSASALAEYYFGDYRGDSNLVYLGVGDGVGVGLIDGGQLIIGEHGYAGEVGHMSIADNGKKCRCGNYDCAELYISSLALLEQTGFESWEALCEAVRHPLDPKFKPIFDQYNHYLETTVVNTIHIYDPARVIIGGHLASWPASYFRKLTQAVNERVIWRRQSLIPVVRSAFGIDASVVSAYTLVFHAFFNGHLDFEP